MEEAVAIPGRPVGSFRTGNARVFPIAFAAHRTRVTPPPAACGVVAGVVAGAGRRLDSGGRAVVGPGAAVEAW